MAKQKGVTGHFRDHIRFHHSASRHRDTETETDAHTDADTDTNTVTQHGAKQYYVLRGPVIGNKHRQVSIRHHETTLLFCSRKNS